MSEGVLSQSDDDFLMKKLAEQGLVEDPNDPPADPPVDPPADPPEPPVDPPADPPVDPPVDPNNPPADPPADPPEPPVDPPALSSELLLQQATQNVLSNIFGNEITSLDEAATKYNEAQVELAELRSLKENNKLTPDLFASDEARQFNNFVRESGISDFSVFSMIKSASAEGTDPVDILLAEMVVDVPQVNRAKARESIMEEYKVEDFENPNDNIKLLKDAAKAKRRLGELSSTFDKDPEFAKPTPPPTREQVLQQQVERAKEWNPLVAQAVSTVSKLEFNTGEKEGEPKFAFTPSTEKIQEVHRAVLNYAATNNIEINDKTKGLVNNLVRSQIIVSSIDDMLKQQRSEIRQMTDEEYKKRYNNVTDLKNPTPPPVETPRQKSGSELAYELEMKDA